MKEFIVPTVHNFMNTRFVIKSLKGRRLFGLQAVPGHNSWKAIVLQATAIITIGIIVQSGNPGVITTSSPAKW